MKTKKRVQLPRGLHWKEDSPYIHFKWRDARGKQHQTSTETADPKEAILFRLQFIREAEERLEESQRPRASYGKLPLKEVAKLYFDQKAADHAAGTIGRERRLFRGVEAFFGSTIRVKAIHLTSIQEYQQKRSAQISPTMQQRITARTINYEIRLLRGVMMHAGCWTGDLAVYYKPLRQLKSKAGKAATNEQLARIIQTAKKNEYWQPAMYCAAVAAGTGCRGGEIRTLRLRDIQIGRGRIRIRAEVAKNRVEREPLLMALAEWGLRALLYRAHQLGATEQEHYLLPFNLRKSRHWSKKTDQKWDPTRPMVSWVKSWRKLMAACQMPGFRFHDLRHTFRTQGAEAGVPLEVMMAQLGHMDRETSLDYVHIQQRALQRAKELIEREQAQVLAAAQGKAFETPAHRITSRRALQSSGPRRLSARAIAQRRRLSLAMKAASKWKR